MRQEPDWTLHDFYTRFLSHFENRHNHLSVPSLMTLRIWPNQPQQRQPLSLRKDGDNIYDPSVLSLFRKSISPMRPISGGGQAISPIREQFRGYGLRFKCPLVRDIGSEDRLHTRASIETQVTQLWNHTVSESNAGHADVIHCREDLRSLLSDKNGTHIRYWKKRLFVKFAKS